jgi:hypothetical protein
LKFAKEKNQFPEHGFFALQAEDHGKKISIKRGFNQSKGRKKREMYIRKSTQITHQMQQIKLIRLFLKKRRGGKKREARVK